MNSITLAGNPVNLAGNFPKNGETVSDFELVKSDLSTISLKDFQGKRKVLNIFPSLDTGICAMSVVKFNENAAKLKNTVVLCISNDLPFAHARFCSGNNIENVVTLSGFRNNEYAENLGVKMVSGPLSGLTARAVIVLDENNQVLHSELAPEIKQEVDFEAAFNSLK